MNVWLWVKLGCDWLSTENNVFNDFCAKIYSISIVKIIDGGEYAYPVYCLSKIILKDPFLPWEWELDCEESR
jgi:hypothetical protein